MKLAVIAAVLMTACATNPVTGKREISFMSEAVSISAGRPRVSQNVVKSEPLASTDAAARVTSRSVAATSSRSTGITAAPSENEAA